MPNLIELIYDKKFTDAQYIINTRNIDELNLPDNDSYPIHAVVDFSSHDELSPEEKTSLHNLAVCLIRRGVRLDVECEGLMPIHYVCARENGCLKVLEAILETGFDPSTPDNIGETPLHHALKAGVIHKDIIKRLLACPGLVMSKTYDFLDDKHKSKTPQDYAVMYYPDIESDIHNYMSTPLVIKSRGYKLTLG